MSDYDFHQLSPLEFERLSRDLFQAEEGLTLESFREGKDGGIDFRHVLGQSVTILQCKHCVRGGLPSLMGALRKEVTKVKRLKPTRYVLITSVGLSPDDKTNIRNLIGTDYLREGDIWGQDQLNGLLVKHEKIERTHFKLWLASRAVLDRVLHNEIVTQTDFEVRKAYKNIVRYVQSSAYPDALKVLETTRVVVISGKPGVGKSTLANALLYRHLEWGYSPVVIKRDIAEGQKLFEFGKEQIFHYDDFMGATFLGEQNSSLDRNGDRAILDFIEMVRDTPSSRLVLTTREHIFSQAVATSERIRHSHLSDQKIVVEIDQYSLRQKAEILYNHIYFSDLPEEYRATLLYKEFYLEILKHPKFNPRLVEWLSSYQKVKSHSVDKYPDFVKRLLANPSEIWMHAYHEQLSDAARSMLLALYTYGGTIGRALLSGAFAKLHPIRAKRNFFSMKPEDEQDAIAELANAFIRPTASGGLEVIDPSVLDLMNDVVLRAPQNAVQLAIGATSPSQIERIWHLARNMGQSSLLPVIRREMAEIIGNLEKVLLADRRFQQGGAVFFTDLTFEKRLLLLLSIHEGTGSAILRPLIAKLLDRMQAEWVDDDVDVHDATMVLRTLPSLTLLAEDDVSRVRETIAAGILEDLNRRSARPDEIREVIVAFGLKTSDVGEMKAVLTRSYERYREDYFSDELRGISTGQEYEALLDDLRLLQDVLGVNAEGPIDAVATALSEHEDYESSYADAHEDDWKEQRYEQRATDAEIRDMFDTLRDI
ncbi:hypothetical protein FS827_25335 [Agrobacterium vitis]|uniref:nSTAND3 domain-containing NTPase n=1 Tax=Allorhizobium ampelinum TaxID=3025782 RepID=UPI001F41BF3C|nr:restriction endonuclease [Allorhizobium ampelinum]MCF1464609.1 hypothetical protein [Allorhizobium ampelinum]